MPFEQTWLDSSLVLRSAPTFFDALQSLFVLSFGLFFLYGGIYGKSSEKSEKSEDSKKLNIADESDTTKILPKPNDSTDARPIVLFFGILMFLYGIYSFASKETITVRCDSESKLLTYEAKSMIARVLRSVSYSEVSEIQIREFRIQQKGRPNKEFMPVLILYSGESLELLTKYTTQEDEAAQYCAAIDKAIHPK